MNYTELVKKAEKRRINKSVGKTLDAVREIISEEITKGNKVVWTKFFSIKTKTRKGREILSPSTRKPITIPDTKVVAFQASKYIKRFIKK